MFVTKSTRSAEQKSSEAMFRVYLITNNINGLAYVGMTSRSVVLRFYEHVVTAYRGKQTPLTNAIIKYGPSSFSFSILGETPSKIEAMRLEQSYIQQYKSTNRTFGYNQNAGGSGMLGMVHTIAWRAEQSRRMTGRNHPLWGKHHSNEIRAKISASKTGKKLRTRRLFPLDEIRRAYADGASLRSLASQYQTDKGVLSSRLREIGVKIRSRISRESY